MGGGRGTGKSRKENFTSLNLIIHKFVTAQKGYMTTLWRLRISRTVLLQDIFHAGWTEVAPAQNLFLHRVTH
jgi:hypothetical protein